MTIYTKDYVKDPVAVKDYEVDWTDWLGTDTIATSSWSVPTGITNTTDSIVAGNLKTIVWLSGGSALNDYECFNTITTAGGRTERAMIKIQVRQMDFTVQIEGLDKLAKASAEIKQSVESEVQKGLFASAQKIRTEAITSIQDGQKSGRLYKHRTVIHRASAPGEAPATDTGRLVNSITAYNGGEGEAFTVAGRGTALYAPLLEFGTSKMAPRPFMVPALEKSKAWIVARLQDAVRRGLNRGK